MSASLSHSPGEIIQRLLIALGLGTLPSADDSWPICSPTEPDKETIGDNVITVTHTAGLVGSSEMVGGTRQSRPGVQIRVRCNSHKIGYAKANEIAVALDETINYDTVTVPPATGTGDSTYLVFNLNRTGDILDLGRRKEVSNCYLFTINALVALKQL